MDTNENIEHLISGYHVPAVKSKAEAWELLQQKMKYHQSVPEQKQHRLSWWIGSVAAAAIFLAILWIGMFNTGKYSPEVVTSIAAAEELVLPDSSSVFLASNSSAKYNYNKITGERNVVLQGEAYFDVKKGRKFTVDFGTGSIKVLGTSFNVSAYGENLTEIGCHSGEVEINIHGQRFKISEGQEIKQYRNKITGPYYVNPADIKNRMNGLFSWNNVEVGELMELVGYRFAYKYKLSEDLSHRKFTGKVELNSLEESLMILAYAMDIGYTIDESQKLIKLNER